MLKDGKFNFIGIGKGIAFSLILTFVFILVIAVVCYFANVSDGILALSVLAAAGMSVLLGALFVSRNAQGLGLIHGLILSVGYLTVTYVAGVLYRREFCFNIQLLSMIMCVLSSGMLGGILGINSKK